MSTFMRHSVTLQAWECNTESYRRALATADLFYPCLQRCTPLGSRTVHTQGMLVSLLGLNKSIQDNAFFS